MSKHIVSAFSYPLEAEELIKNVKKIAEREEKTLSKLIVELLTDYAKKHGDGNPAFTLDHFQDKNFKVCPAVFRPKHAWDNYLSNLNKKEFKEFESQMNTIIQSYKDSIKKVYK
jgi:hypothetical protein